MWFGKAVIAYNQGANANVLRNRNYFASLQGTPRRDENGNFSPTHFGYWLAVKSQSWNMRGMLGAHLPYTTYIWVGARDEEGEPDWCFAYGEREWRGGSVFDRVKENAEEGIAPQLDCVTGEVINDN